MSKSNTIEQDLKQKYEEVFRQNLHKVQFIARHYLKDFDTSKDVAQEVFSTLWQKRETVDFSRPMLPYLSVLTKNRCLNILKNHKIQQTHRNLKIDLIHNSTAHKILSEEIEKLIVDSLGKMSESIKDAFMLSRFENKKYEEIAQIQNVSIKTIEYRIMSALKVLRRELKDFIIFF